MENVPNDRFLYTTVALKLLCIVIETWLAKFAIFFPPPTLLFLKIKQTKNGKPLHPQNGLTFEKE